MTGIRCLLASMPFVTGGCFAYRPVALTPTHGTAVRIVMKSPSAIASVGPGSDSDRRVHPGVLEASGVIRSAAADTIALELGALRTAGGSVAGLSGRVALIPTASVARIESRQFDAGTTLVTGVGLTALALTGFLIVVIVAITRGV